MSLVRFAFALGLASAILAGCVQLPGDDAPTTARLACIESVCNFVATAEPATRQANELSIAVNPKDPLNIIATGKDYTPDEAGDCVWAGVYATLDGGLTWKAQNVPGSPWKRLKDPTVPVTPFSKFWCATDPVVAFGPDGTAYWTVMPYQCDAASGGKTGRGVLPQGGFNDWMWTCSAMYVLVSTDGGLTWPVDKARMVAEGPRLAHDKQWLTVSPKGDVLLCWDYAGPASTTTGLPYASPDAAVVCSVSKDKGESWSAFATATDAGGFPWLDHDSSGRAWMAITAGFEEGDIMVLSSEDGLKWTEPVPAASFKNGDGRNEYGWPTLEGSSFRIVPHGALAIDRSGGPHDGRIYVAYFDHARGGDGRAGADAAGDASSAAGNGDAMLTWSDDGANWTAPVKVNDDAGEADQFMPVVSVGRDGTVDVSWQDRRDDPDNHLFHTYYAYSLDGGLTFSKNMRVSDVASDEKWSHHQNGMVFLGDYRDSDSGDGSATLVWVDTRNEKADVMVATVLRPSANAG